jgi:glyoxylase-like metal-dependent hydrolase (beta-lactamase superfamily II)
MPPNRSLGSLTIVALEDGAGTFFQPRAEAFPEAGAEHWRLADAADPAAVTGGGEWLLRFRCFAIRPSASAGVILVDTGIGPVDAPAASWAPVPGRLPEELAAAGIVVGDVTTVVLTHLHTDHVGWAVVGAGEPYFPNARYLLQRAEVEAVDRINPTLDGRLLDPLRATGQLDVADGAVALDPAVQVVPTPGHTPGHQSVLLIADDGQTVLVTGDLLVHAVQLVDPDLAYAHEMDPVAARESRRALLGDLTARGGAILATPHLSAAFAPLA